MPTKFHCPSCAASITAPDSAAGKQGKCPKCGTSIQIPASSEETSPAREKITFNCDACHKSLSVPTTLAGRRGKCPHCKSTIQVPEALIDPGDALVPMPDEPEGSPFGGASDDLFDDLPGGPQASQSPLAAAGNPLGISPGSVPQNPYGSPRVAARKSVGRASALLALGLLVLVGCGSEQQSSSAVTSGMDNELPERDPTGPGMEAQRYPNDYRSYENSIVADGTQGPIVLAAGRVLRVDGAPQPETAVTLEQRFRDKPSCCWHVTSDAEGRYVVRGEVPLEGGHMIWAATPEGELGSSWVTQPEGCDIHLRGGQTVLHVRNERCEPVVGASVTVYLSGIDDMSWVIPKNLRALLTKKSDQEGVVRYPSRLGDHDLGFDVSAKGYRPLARDFYSGLFPKRVKLFVFSVDDDVTNECARRFLAEQFPDGAGDKSIETGRPDHF